jgi:hypothetical protein
MALSNNFQSTLGRMDGSSLTYIAGAPTGNAYALANFNGKLYMGGQLTYNSNYGVLAYNGTTYTALPNPLSPNCTVWDLYSDGTALYGGGNFTTNSQYPVALNGFFKYNTNYRLASVDGGFSGGDVYCIASTGSYFVCGGTFTTTGSSTSALRVARSTNLTIGIDEPENVVIDHIIYPNPVIQSATIRFTSREYLRNAYLRIMDQQGRTVAELPSDNSSNDLVSEFYINREGLAAGIYYYFLESDNSRPAGGKFIVQ